MLTDYERRMISERRRRRLIIGGTFVALLVVAVVAARPTRNAIKSWQARRHATKAFALIEQENWSAAKEEAVAAYQLRQTEPQALRAVARLLSRIRQPQALEFWDLLAKQAPLTREDLRDEATVALAIGEAARAETAIAALVKEAPTPRDELLAAQLALQKGQPADAQSRLDHVLNSSGASEAEQFEAAYLQVRATAAAPPEDPRRAGAWERLVKLSQGRTPVALQALVLLAQRQLSSTTDAAAERTAVPSVSASALADALEAHPLAKAPHKLLALDLRAQADPSQRGALLDRAITDFANADPASQGALATWLNGKGEHQRELDAIPLDRAIQTRELFLQHVDALGALGRWEEIRKLLEAERFPLDPVIQRMYLARCNAQLGEQTASENNWQRALEAASGDPQKLMTLADYAEKNGASAIADAAFTAAAVAMPKLRAAQQGRLRAAEAARDTKRMHAILTEMLQLWPNDTAIQNDEAYTRLLLLPNDTPDPEELIAIERIASRLVEIEPASLPHRTLLALARLKQHRPVAALDAYHDIQVTPAALAASALAVHAAVLAANDHRDDARIEIKQAPLEKLLPEEQAGTADLRD